MPLDVLLDRNPLRALVATTRGAVHPGQIGAIFGDAGVGKSGLLTAIGAAAAATGVPVLHLALVDPPARIRSAYDELLASLSRVSGGRGARSLPSRELKRFRLVAAAPAPCDAAVLDTLLQTLAHTLDHRPGLVLLDGLTEAVDPVALRAIAAARGLRLWASVAASAADTLVLADAWDTAAHLHEDGDQLLLQPLREAGAPSRAAAAQIDPVTMLLERPVTASTPLPAASPPPQRCTLYSGGATGAEATFGELAEQYGVQEVHFSFDGHNQARHVGRRVLSARALAAGDVSLLTVAHRLHRHWDPTETLRRVLQCQWHMVSHCTQLFVVGSIQPDGTVHGGTGWSVELARRWNKCVWVFDQNHDAWFVWTGTTWTRGEPVIESHDFAATGTRFLNEAGRRAILTLFANSFGATTRR